MKEIPKRENVLVFVYTKNPSLKFLMLKRIPEKSAYWQPVCGGIKPHETYQETVHREVLEETGINKFKHMINLEYSFTYTEEKDGQLWYMEDHCFAIELPNVQNIQLSHEHEEFKWMNLEEVSHLFKWELGLDAFNKLCAIIYCKGDME